MDVSFYNSIAFAAIKIKRIKWKKRIMNSMIRFLAEYFEVFLSFQYDVSHILRWIP